MMYIQYLWYVLRHKWYVFIECCKRSLYWRGAIHDWSKFLPDEFIPYAKHFYGFKNKEGYLKENDTIEDAPFDLAWLKHQKRNDHHWQYWILKEDDGDLKIQRMSEETWEEMICDWKGAGKAQGFSGEDECKKWYLKNRDKIQIHPDTRREVELTLKIEQ